MKLKFKHQGYQFEATQAVVDLFSGQLLGERRELRGREILNQGTLIEEMQDITGFSNKKIELTPGELLKNLNDLQKQFQIPLTEKLEGRDFSIEMETGTGKTYVYTKTMFELNEKYGWSKFIIMVPSVAIREGVHKSLQITADHFFEDYGKKIRFFVYDSKNKSNITNIKSYANTNNIEVIVMNYQAFASRAAAARLIYQEMDATNSEKPIDLIKRARPILIIDEPQRFGDTAEKMIPEFDPLFTLRYSATPKKYKKGTNKGKEVFPKIYRLDAIDAYNQKLVKKIAVKGVEAMGSTGTNGYLYVDQIITSTDKPPRVRLGYELKQKSGVKKSQKIFSEGDDFYYYSNNLEQYRNGYVISEINARDGYIRLSGGNILYPGQMIGDINQDQIRRTQIRETIVSHIQKEQQLYQKGIKVLSLFFIDEVAKYRQYDELEEQLLGEYGKMFEEEYQSVVAELKDLFQVDYNNYLDGITPQATHAGYFSIDGKGKMIDSKESDTANVSTYELIMKNKEQLLSFEEPVRFIFSHSALSEGRDNPNVFQICTLRQRKDSDKKRQEIGRGLRISVNKEGERMDYESLGGEFHEVNTLTVVANESYADFSKALQDAIWADLSDRPTEVSTDVLKNVVLKNQKEEQLIIDDTMAMDLVFEYKGMGYLDSSYQLTDKFLEAYEQEELQVPDAYQGFEKEVAEFMYKIYTTANYKAVVNDKLNTVNEQYLKPNDNFHKKEFQALWNKINHKSRYIVQFDDDELFSKVVESVNKTLNVKQIKIRVSEGEQKSSMSEEDLRVATALTEKDVRMYKSNHKISGITYDLINEITKETKLTRRLVAKILSSIREDKFKQFALNPEDFITQIVRIIKEEKATTLIKNVVYHKTEERFDEDIFTINTLHGDLQENVLAVKKHIYDYVKTDSKVERELALKMESGEVSVYAKLPRGFYIDTPVGKYNPDRAIVFDKEEVRHLYFVAETKGSLSKMDISRLEDLKIGYAEKHFEALKPEGVHYVKVTDYETLMDAVMRQ